MNIEWQQNKHGAVREVDVELTRTNLMTLLSKLDGHPPNSACTIFKMIDGAYVQVKAVEDSRHYSDRPRGIMHPDTEQAMRESQ